MWGVVIAPAAPDTVDVGDFASFLEQAKKNGSVRNDVDSDMIAGFLLDRILKQVQLAP